MLIHACPCGFFGDPTQECTCSQGSIDKYLGKISNPLLDRIDIHIEVSPVKYAELRGSKEEESSRTIRERVKRARDLQLKRFERSSIFTNSEMSNRDLKKYCNLARDTEEIMKYAFNKYKFSGRTYNKILKVSRTIADLDGKESIESIHVLEAIRYRTLDSKYWG